MVQELVSQAMTNCQPALSEKEWFFDLNLIPTFVDIAETIIAEFYDIRVAHNAIMEVAKAESDSMKHSFAQDQAMWFVCEQFLEDPKQQKSLCNALSKTWATATQDTHRELDATNRDIYKEMKPQEELQRLERFLKRWLNDALSRAWATLESTGFDVAAMIELVKLLIAPYGEEDWMSLIPKSLTETLGRPPLDWTYAREVSEELWAEWNGGKPAKKRRVEEDFGSHAHFHAHANRLSASSSHRAPQAPPARAPVTPPRREERPQSRSPARSKAAAMRARTPTFGRTSPTTSKASQPPARSFPGSIALAMSTGHPDCTCAQECRGNPATRLVRHILNGQGADVYCETCWADFMKQMGENNRPDCEYVN